jgi:glycosyltransferase involved in cell wall biosynthesis
MPAYNAARTIERTYREIPLDLVDEVIVTDDASHDETVEIARRLGAPKDAVLRKLESVLAGARRSARRPRSWSARWRPAPAKRTS